MLKYALILLLVFFIGCQAQTVEVQEPSREIAEIQEFSLDAQNYRFLTEGGINPDIRVKQGDTVRITLTSIEGFHDWTVDELNVQSERISTGELTVIEFVADEQGVFAYYCSVGNHRLQGMIGNLIVE